jgi:YVTN family beta-propeller protein
MKKMKYIVLVIALLFVITSITSYLVKRPSYTIQTRGKLYVFSKLSSDYKVIDLKNGKEVVENPIEIEPHEAVVLTSQNRIVVTNYGNPDTPGNCITVINTKTNKVEKIISLNGSLRPHGIVSFPNSTKVGVLTDLGNDLSIVNIETGSVEKKIPTQQEFSHLLVLHPFKSFAYVTNIKSGSVSVIDLDLNKVIQVIPCGLGTEGIDITPDGSELWVTNNKDNTVSIINTSTYKVIHTLTTGKEPLRLKFSIDGKYCLVANSSGGTISVFDQRSKKQIKTIIIRGKNNIIQRLLYHTPRPVGILMHPDGLFAFVSNSNANEVEVIDMKTFEIVSTIGTGKIPDGLAFIN